MSYTDDQVRRVRQAIWESYIRTHTAPLQYSNSPAAITVNDLDRMARAALEAVQPEPLEDVLRLDDVLEHIHPRAWFNFQRNDERCVVMIQRPKECGTSRDIVGTGRTFSEAWRDCAKPPKGGEK